MYVERVLISVQCQTVEGKLLAVVVCVMYMSTTQLMSLRVRERLRLRETESTTSKS